MTTLSPLILIVPLLALAACQTTTQTITADTRPAPTKTVTTSAAPGTLQRPAGSRTVAQLDASATEKAAATQPTKAGASLGRTVASLGDATQGGFWIKTPLVKAKGKGRIVNPATGKSVNVDLIPLGGPASAGSQVSLPALTTLGADLTDLPTVEVFGA